MHGQQSSHPDAVRLYLRFAFCPLPFDLQLLRLRVVARRSEVTPHPSRDGWKKRRRGPPSPPRERAVFPTLALTSPCAPVLLAHFDNL